MSERYTEQPPEGSFEQLDDIHTMDDLNKLALLYEFQINAMSADLDGKCEPEDSYLEEQIRTCINLLDHFAEKLQRKGEPIEITGTGLVPGDPNAHIGDATGVYNTFKGLYLGFTARQERQEESGLLRYEFGHFIFQDTIRIHGFLRDRTEVLRAFIPVASTELIETPQERSAREIQFLAAKLDTEDGLAHGINSVLFDSPSELNMPKLGELFSNSKLHQLPPKQQDLYLDYLNLKTDFDGKSMSVVSSCALLPSPERPELINAEGTIIGISRGFCLSGSIDMDAEGGPEINDKPDLYLAMEVVNDGKQLIVLIPAQRISVYEMYEDQQ